MNLVSKACFVFVALVIVLGMATNFVHALRDINCKEIRMNK